MLASRILPPQFLLPAWSAQQLCAMMQRLHHSTERRSPRATNSERHGNRRPTRKRLSLFDELFPEERQHLFDASTEIEKLPPFKWDDGSEQPAPQIAKDDRGGARRWSRVIPQQHQYVKDEKRQRREASVLVLNAVTKALEESDFFRLSPKGEHIEGWTSGIIKVIPGRDPNTLENLGHYFILFSNDGAARAYLDQTIRLHTLAKTHVRSQGVMGIPPPPGLLKEGEDLQTILRGFSLVPAYSKLSLRLINRPYQPAMVRLLSEGGPAAITSRQRKAENMVLFSVDGAHINHRDLSEAISIDGKRRNLHWRLAGGAAKLSGSRDDIVSLSDSQPVEADLNEEAVEDGAADTDEVRVPKKRQFRLPPRYIICFADRNESRRFVREWHRRPFPRNRGQKSLDDLPAIVNAEILW